MTVKEAIEKVQALRPCEYGEDELRDFIEECDRKLYRDVIERFQKDEGTDSYEERYPLSTEDELLGDEAYAMIYVWYAICQVDLFLAETDRYVNDMFVYNKYYGDFRDYWGRTHSALNTVVRYTTD